jgi:hypothetical protein
VIRPDTVRPPTATDLLENILARDDAPTSATSLQQQLTDPRLRLGQAVARYTDALLVAAEDLAGDLAVRALERRVDQLLPGVPWCEAWPALRAHLLLIAADGRDPLTELAAAAATELGSAADPAAVLDWRLDATGLRNGHPGPLPWLPATPSRLAEHPQWGPYLDARAHLVADLADRVHRDALTGDEPTPAWLAAHLGRPTAQTIADVAVWRAATAVPDADLRPTGERQLPKAAARWQRHLDRRLTGDQQPALREWGPLLHGLAPQIAGDPFTATLAQRLAQLSAAGLNVRGLLSRAAAEGDLPDDHPAAALWWRIARHLTPAVATAVDHDQLLTAPWTSTLPELVGAERATHLQYSRWWPALITAVDHGLHQGWTPADLLTAAPAGDGNVDDCLALVWRVSTLTQPPHGFGDEPGDPFDEHPAPADLWDGYQPTNPIIVADPADHPAARATDQVTEPHPVDPTEADEGPGLAIEAIIRNGLATPEPTGYEIEKLLARADAWHDSNTTPQRLAQVNRLTADYYQACYRGSWAQPYLAERFGTDLAGHPDLQPGYAPAGWTNLVTHLHRHGVPGAFMSIIGHNSLNKIVRESGITKPSDILDHLNIEVVHALLQRSEKAVRDGMDISVISYDILEHTVDYAGAYQPLYHVREGKVTIYRGDRFPIGMIDGQARKSFTNHRVEVKPGDMLYIFTDGFADQFGGEHEKKFKTINIRSLLAEIHMLPVEEQKFRLEKAIREWMGDLAQVDDILFIGTRVP